MPTAAEGRQIKSNQTANKKTLEILTSTKILLGEFMCTLSGKFHRGKVTNFSENFMEINFCGFGENRVVRGS